MPKDLIRIAAGCSADITLSLPQMARYGEIDYLILDYMMEHSVARMAAARITDPHGGYGAGFIGPEMETELQKLLGRNVRIITNAGGLNPNACADAFRKLATGLGLNPKVAVVTGDNFLEHGPSGLVDMFSGHPVPESLASRNAYLGAAPIAAALSSGADIVITGRVVDSALTLGPLIDEFGWKLDDWDLLATGSIIGHLLECGAQPSGGIHTDWRDIDFANSSFPIAEVKPNGEVDFVKVPGTGGKISIGTIAEQLVYEIGDPQRYFLPDVTADFSQVKLEQIDADRVRLTGARGYPPTGTYKVCGIEQVGWRAVVSTVISGKDSIEKARKTADAVLKRTERFNLDRNWGEFAGTNIEVIGAGDSLGEHKKPVDAQEVVYRMVADHPRREAVETLLRVNYAVGPSMAPGTGAHLGPEIKPRMKLWSYLLEKEQVDPVVEVNGTAIPVGSQVVGGFEDSEVPTYPAIETRAPSDGVSVPLERLAYTRSGDKGDFANIGIVARKVEYLPYIANALTVASVTDWYRHVFANPGDAKVERFELPGIGALNFLLHHALDGGAVSSRRFDDMGKALGQQLLDFPVAIPAYLARRI